MYNASNILVKARAYYIPKKKKRKINKIQVFGRKKTKYYLPDIDYYWNVYLKSEHWKELKNRKLLVNPNCENCNVSSYLDVHHIDYKNLYDVELIDLKTLCRKCHNEEHKRLRVQKMIINQMKPSTIKRKEEELYNELCLNERILIQKDMRNYHKSNESDCQSE